MAIADVLPDFSGVAPSRAGHSSGHLEEVRLQAFENGYNAGWEDAAKSIREEGGTIASEFAQNLSDLSFTYQEAYGHVLSCMRPLLEEIVSVVVPKLARDTIGLRVIEELSNLSGEQMSQPIHLNVAPTDAELIGQMVEAANAPPITIVPDDTLAQGQLHFRFGQNEKMIDLSTVQTGIAEAVSGFFDEQEKEIVNG